MRTYGAFVVPDAVGGVRLRVLEEAFEGGGVRRGVAQRREVQAVVGDAEQRLHVLQRVPRGARGREQTLVPVQEADAARHHQLAEREGTRLHAADVGLRGDVPGAAHVQRRAVHRHRQLRACQTASEKFPRKFPSICMEVF